MTDAASGYSSCISEHCITCSDEAVEMTVVRVDHARELALCEDGESARSTVETALVAPVAEGDRLLVHAGVAIAMLDREDGVQTPEAVNPRPRPRGAQEAAVLAT
jgi:hydrogenase expression/formation protein HypC